MGISELRVNQKELGLLISDWGPNRFLFYDHESKKLKNRASEHNIGFGRINNHLLAFSWSPISFDFNKDHIQDVFLTVGMIPNEDHNAWDEHFDRLFLQDEKGLFNDISSQISLKALASEGSGTDRTHSSRSGKIADLNLDGKIEIIIAGMEGKIKIYQETSDEDNCTIRPQSRYVATWGSYFSFRSSSELDWMPITNQGSLMFGGASSLLVPEKKGELLFPSGAVVAFECGDVTGEIFTKVSEPQWLEVKRKENTLKISTNFEELAEEVGPLTAVHSCTTGEELNFTEIETQSYQLEEGETNSLDKVMLKFFNRWIEQCF